MDEGGSTNIVDLVDLATGLVPGPLLVLGKAIGKPLFSDWWRRTKRLQTTAGKAEDILRASLEGMTAQEEMRHRFERIGHQIVGDLLPLFAGTNGDLHAEQNAVVEAVAYAFSTTDISPDLVARLHSSPENLARNVIAVRPDDTKSFSAAGAELYHRLTLEIARRIVLVTPRLDAYQWVVTRELLERLQGILDDVSEVLERLRRTDETSALANSESAARYYETEYRQRVADNQGWLELFGSDLIKRSHRQALDRAFIYLNVTTSSDRSYDPDRAAYGRRLSAGVASPSPIPIHIALANADRHFIRGMAGSGKTTILQWIAVRSAAGNFPDVLNAWQRSVPFLINLRRLKDGTIPRPSEFPSLAAQFLGTPPNNWTEQQLKNGRAIVLIDGVDEVEGSLRNSIRKQIVELVRTYGSARYVVTSRPQAATADWLAELNFTHSYLLPLDNGTVPTFVDAWHDAVAASLPVDQRPALTELANELKRKLRDSGQLREIATTPLLCALLCALHRDHRGALPEDRVAFFDATCRFLLNRDPARDVQFASLPNLTDAQQTLLLQDFAWWLVRNNSRIDAQIGQAESCFARRMEGVARLPVGTTPQLVRQLFLERSGLVREPEDGIIEFVHNAFRDFLAARDAVRVDDINVLIQNAWDDRWRDVILFTAGMGNRDQRRELLTGIMKRGDSGGFMNRAFGAGVSDRLTKKRLYLLAASCQRQSLDIDPEVRAQIEARIRRITPPKTSDDADAIAAAGDLAVPFLQAPVTDETVALACVRALVGIGTLAALDQLAGFAADPRPAVEGSILAAWANFNADEFARRIFLVCHGVAKL